MDRKEIRAVRAEHAVKAAETRLTAQAAGLATIETRAMALIGWASVAAAGALAVTFGGAHDAALRWAAGAGAAVAAIAGIAASGCLRTNEWVMPGHHPTQVMQGGAQETDTEFYESLARGYQSGITANSARLHDAATRLDLALAVLGWAIPTALAAGLLGPGLGRAIGGL